MEICLSSTEEFVLLSLDKKMFKFNFLNPHLPIYTCCCALLELMMKEKIKINEKGEVIVLDTVPTGEKYLDNLLEIISSSKKKLFKKWIEYFYGLTSRGKKIHKAVIEGLCNKNLLKIEKNKKLLFFSKKEYKHIGNYKDHIVEKIRSHIIEDRPVDENSSILILVLKSNKMLKPYFSSYEQRLLEEKLRKLQEDDISNRFKYAKSIIEMIDVIAGVAGAMGGV